MLYTREIKQNTSKALMEEWNWLTEGVDDQIEKLNLSLLLHNAKETMVLENTIPEEFLDTLLNEDVATSGDVHVNGAGANELIPKVIFPLIRRVFPNLIANKLIGIQPLTRPTGIIYYLIYKFSNTKGDVVRGDEYDAFPWDGNPRSGYSAYYSSNRMGPFEGVIGSSGSNTTITSNIKTFFDEASENSSINTDVRRLTKVEVYNKTTGEAYNATLVSVAPSSAGEVQADGTSNDVVLVDSAVGPWNTGDDVVIFVIYDQEANDKMPELDLTIDSIDVKTRERKLRVKWTKESEQDFKAYHSIDIENELVKASAQEMTYEIDREIIAFIERTVIPELSMIHDWTNDSPKSGNNSQGNYLDRHRALADKIMRLSAKIAVYNRQGPANWIVCSPQTAAILSQLPSFQTEINGAGSNFNVKYMGKLYSSIDVYADPVRGYHTGTGGSSRFSDTILLGYKQGNNPYATGIIYSPYTNWMSNTIINPDNFNSIRGFFTRYAITKVPRGQYYYGKLNILNLII